MAYVKTFEEWRTEYIAAYPNINNDPGYNDTLQYLYNQYRLSMGASPSIPPTPIEGVLSYEEWCSVGSTAAWTESQKWALYNHYRIMKGLPSLPGVPDGILYPEPAVAAPAPLPVTPVKPVEVVKPVSKPPLWQFWNWGKRGKRFGWR